MRYDNNSGYFVNITDEEKSTILQICYDIILNGKLPSTTDPIVIQFIDAFNVKKELYLFTMSTIFPQHMSLSICLN